MVDKSKKNSNYSSVSIPKALMDQIEKIIEENEGLGYSTKAEFVKEAVRIHLNVILNLIKDINK